MRSAEDSSCSKALATLQRCSASGHPRNHVVSSRTLWSGRARLLEKLNSASECALTGSRRCRWPTRQGVSEWRFCSSASSLLYKISARMALTADTKAQVSFRELFTHDYFKGEGVGTFLTVGYKRVVNGVTYTLRTTDTTYRKLRSLNGAGLSISKPFGPLKATGGIELGPVKSLGAELIGKWTFEEGRSLELKGLWSEKTGATTLTATAVPHKQVKVKSTVNSRTQAIVSDADLKLKGFTLSPAANWQSGAKGVALSHKFLDGTLKGSYAIERQVAGVEFTQKPFKVSLVGPVNGSKRFHPTLTLGIDSVFNLSNWLSNHGRKADKHAGSRVPDVRRDIPLETRLKELDASYEPRIKKAEAKLHAHRH